MAIKKLNKRKVPIVVIDKSLNTYDDVVLFPDKVDKANEMLRRVGLPHKLNGYSRLKSKTRQAKHKVK